MLSMTGYGKASACRGDISLEVELRTVNNRFLDIYIRSDDSMRFLDSTLRGAIQKKLGRGHVDLYLSNKSQSGQGSLRINRPALIGLLKDYGELFGLNNIGLKKVNEDGNLNYAYLIQESLLRPEQLLLIPGIVESIKDDYDQNLIEEVALEALEKALDSCISLRKTEGERLKNNISDKLEKLIKLHKDIEDREPFLVKEERERLEERLSSLMPKGMDVDRGILENELAIYAQKAAIDEELVRLMSHFKTFKIEIEKEKPVGKTLDFIIQEMNREVNTISSKSNDDCIRALTIKAKTIIEEIREQIQNVE